MDTMLRPMMNMYLDDPSVRADIERMVSDFLSRAGIGYVVMGLDKVDIGNGNAEIAGTPTEIVPVLALLAYQELGIDVEPPDRFRSWLGDLRESMGGVDPDSGQDPYIATHGMTKDAWDAAEAAYDRGEGNHPRYFITDDAPGQGADTEPSR